MIVKQQILEAQLKQVEDQLAREMVRVVDFSAIITQMNAIVRWQANRIPGFSEIGSWGIKPQLHQLTCGNNSKHAPLMPLYDLDKQKVVLVCPDCDYTQETLPPVFSGGVEFPK